MILIRISTMAFFKVHPQEFTEMYREASTSQHSIEGDGDVFLDLLAEHEAQGHDVALETSAYAEMYGLVQYPGHEVRYWLNPTR